MRKNILFVLLALLALAPAARAQQARGYYDQYGRYHEYADQGGYYDQYGQFHPYQDQNGGYYDRDGQWHPSATQNDGYYDRNGVWHPYATQNDPYYDRNNRYGTDRNGRVAGPDRWVFSERGRAESLDQAARNFAATVATLDREAARRSRFADRAALDALRRLDQQAQYLARTTFERNRGDLVGQAYANVVAAFLDAQRRFGALQPDGWLANQSHVMAAAIGRLDKRYFGNRAFGGRNPGNLGYGYDNGNGYDQYGNQYPYDRHGRDTRPRPYPY
ncbi:MAG TPA: hypothetical protein VGV61_05510 [Thermoanaerobaculia bacterium]|jgi:hypothetical protein|nr:hypothetical protein [Thermoanaerobaculia bacterium]